MQIAALTLVAAVTIAQAATPPAAPPQPQAAAPQATTPELPVLDARLGGCTADFTVKNPAGAPVYTAVIHVQVRYGPLSVKRMDLEVGTNSEGRARVEGLPAKGTPLTYDISQADRKGTVTQDLVTSCRAKHEVSLK